MKQMRQHLSCVIALLFTATHACADPVWHCSRNSNDADVAVAAPAQQDQFSIASFNSSADVIGVSVRDLIDIYTGTPVRIGNLPLSACFLSGDHSLSINALTSLGINLGAIEALARKSSIVQNNLYYVNDEIQMSACIARHFPAVGYMSTTTETNKVSPCF